MNDAEISRRLALAIGWRDDPEDPDVVLEWGFRLIGHPERCKVWFENQWRTFDYRDPAVIRPIAERFNCFPTRIEYGWGAWSGGCFWTADTAAKAVALAVIKAHEGGKT